MRIRLQPIVLLFLLSALVAASAQQPAPPATSTSAPATSGPAIDDKFVHDHFGNEFTLMPEFPAMVADMNGDGIDDLVLAVRTKSPMLDAGGFGYTVSDPYHAFFGFGDPKVTSTFTSEDPTRKSIVLLIIHGSGPEAWRSANPKGKFVIINIPVQTVSVRRIKMGKKVQMAIGVEEYGGDRATSAIYWEGNVKKNTGSYKYQPIGAAMD
jgi:hypothetical protein